MYCVQLAALLFSDKALQWFRLISEKSPRMLHQNSEDLQVALLAQFSVVNKKSSARDRLKTLKYTRSVYSYMHKSETISL